MFNPLIDLAILSGFAAALAVPAMLELRRKMTQPKPRGATKI